MPPRTAWMRPAAPSRAPRPPLVLPTAPRVRLAQPAPRLPVVVPKFDYVRSPALLAACRTLACQHCGAADGTVCAAHSNWQVHGKGRGIKASDQYVAALCFRCHSDIDQGSRLAAWEREKFWWRAHRLTVRQLMQAGRWPPGVPVPDIETCPF